MVDYLALESFELQLSTVTSGTFSNMAHYPVISEVTFWASNIIAMCFYFIF